jgi:hypothetical protein
MIETVLKLCVLCALRGDKLMRKWIGKVESEQEKNGYLKLNHYFYSRFYLPFGQVILEGAGLFPRRECIPFWTSGTYYAFSTCWTRTR